MSTVRDRMAKEQVRMAAMGPWFHSYWRSLKSWRHELRKGNRVTTPHWPVPGLRYRPDQWRPKTFLHCACEKRPCPYCADGARTGLPGNACENCMNTGLFHPELNQWMFK